MTKSILQITKECYFCGAVRNLEKHHIYFGRANRRLSEKYGCTCYLCHYHHTGSKDAVHENRENDLKLRRICQKRFEEVYTENFIKVFGRNYL